MAHNQLALIEIHKISTINDVVKQLRQLDKQINVLGLDQFRLFNSAYRVVTISVQQAVEDGYFKNPKFIEKFIVMFSGYYFQAINDTNDAGQDPTPPWSSLNEYALNKRAPKFITLMLGANAHINNDLPQVLNTLLQKEKTEELLTDIVKIDKLLMKSGKQIIGLFEETNKVLDFLKRRLQFTYYRPAMYTILYWRVIAWKNYRKLKKNPSFMSNITKRSVRIANHWLILSKILS